MSTKRNPFNENVDRLMDKIFGGKGEAHAPRKYQGEALPSKNAGVLHDAHPKKKGSGTGKINGKPSVSSFGMQEHDRKEKRSDFLEASLKNITKTTEKIRETTQQLQQMTLKMWAETVQEKEGEGKPYKEERIPPRDFLANRENPPSASVGQHQAAPYHAALSAQTKPDPTAPRPAAPSKPHQAAPRRAAPAKSRLAAPSVPARPYPAASSHQAAPSISGAVVPPTYYTKSVPMYRAPAPQYRMEETLDASVPERIRECKQLARGRNELFKKEKLFYDQAKMMEDYEDDCLYPGEFSWYFPTYQAMNVAQLRGYFTWRTQIRQGNITPAPISFAFVYVYELLHQIGAKTPEEGYSMMQSFWETYREYDTQLDRYLPNWLNDYVVYYNLDRELLASSQDIAFDRALLAFLHPESDDEEYFAAICALSSYNMEGSRFYKEYTADVRRVVCAVFRALTAYYEKHGKKTLTEKYFGTLTTCRYEMFASAVFYDHKGYKEFEYEINPIHRYRCEKGIWSCQKYFGNRKKNKEMGNILRVVDLRMREEYGYKELKPVVVTKIVMNIIDKEIKRFLVEKEKEKEKNFKPVIEIDVTKLSGIRRAAEVTQNRLIVEGADAEWGMVSFDGEEGGKIENAQGMAGTGKSKSVQNIAEVGRNKTVQDMAGLDKAETIQSIAGEEKMQTTQGMAEVGTIKTAQDMTGTEAMKMGQGMMETENGTILNDTERTLLRYLLDGTPYQEFLRKRHQMLSIVVDGINEKLFDQFCDTVIVFDGEVPKVLEDYAPEVAAMLGCS